MSEELLKKWEREELISKAEFLGKVQKIFVRRENLDAFKKTTEILFRDARDAFMCLANIPTEDEFLKHELSYAVTATIVSALNNQLPLEHPYIIAILDIGNTGLKIGIITRTAIPGIHDNLHRNLVPIIIAPTIESLKDRKNLKIDFLIPNEDAL